MTQAPTATKPDDHKCCVPAAYLRVMSTLGKWGWRLVIGVPPISIPVTYCPWCSVKLPTVERKAPRLVGASE